MKSKKNNFQLCINFDEKPGKKENKKIGYTDIQIENFGMKEIAVLAEMARNINKIAKFKI